MNFITDLNAYEVQTLCLRNGSVWIDLYDLMNNDITEDSLCAIGPASNISVRQYGEGIGSIVLTDFDGLAERFIHDTEEDDDGNPRVSD